ncbi:MAG: hypothetical protein L6V93_21765 [Clostridiales bacterium]|nr:MAG: hypothetical protein L6V93_21765 [Clostridiales bacterium]
MFQNPHKKFLYRKTICISQMLTACYLTRTKTELVRYPTRKEGSAYAVSDDVFEYPRGRVCLCRKSDGRNTSAEYKRNKNSSAFYNCTGLKKYSNSAKSYKKIGNVAFAGV